MSSTPSCLAHPDNVHMVPQKTVGTVEISTSTGLEGRTSQEPFGIELPNPNLKVYQNFLGDYASYPVRVPGVEAKKAVLATPAPALYQRATRRPWDISTQQYAVQINKRVSAGFVLLAGLYFGVYPFIPKPNMTTEAGPRPGLGFTSSHGFHAPPPKPSWSFAGN